MIRNLKALGLALVAIFALGAMAASAASADALTAESYPVTLTGAHDAGFAADTFITTAGSVKCPDATYHGTIKEASTTITVTPEFNSPKDSCTIGGGIPAIIDTNGCDFLFHIGTGTLTTGTVDLVCPAGKDLTVTANQNTAGSLTPKCTMHVPPQAVGGITYDNVAGPPKQIRVTIKSAGITYKETAGIGLGTGLGACTPSGELHTGEFLGTELLTGETDTGSTHIGLFLTESMV